MRYKSGCIAWANDIHGKKNTNHSIKNEDSPWNTPNSHTGFTHAFPGSRLFPSRRNNLAR
jgi:hypothetical protein